jgi:hypothetical protein
MKKFLALYVGQPLTDEQRAAAMADEDQRNRGMAAWGAWMAEHADAVIDSGGPLGKTKKASRVGVTDIRNNAAGYVVVQAESHEAAVKMFEGHPHFTIFPGEGVEVMEILPIPGG